MRLVAILAIIAIHAVQLDSPGPKWRSVILHACHFAVPYFFMVSGFFFARRIADIDALKTQTIRFLSIYAIALVGYILLTPLSHIPWPPIDNPLRVILFILNGPGYHLWFLPALVMAFWGLHILRPMGFAAVFTVGGAAYITGLLIEPYHNAAHLPGLGLNDVTWAAVARPFSSFLFVAIGLWFAERKSRINLGMAILLALIGLTLQMAESLWLYQSGYGTFNPPDYSMGTLVFGVGVFLATLTWKGNVPPVLAKWGQLTLWIYIFHPAVLYVLRLVLKSNQPLPSLERIILACALSFALALVVYSGRLAKAQTLPKH